MTLYRRTFLAGLGASLLASCINRRKLPEADYDCAIVGAGAAGISAARFLLERGKRVVLLEARSRVGGRAWTDTETWGIPFDQGAAWLHHFRKNPLRKFVDEDSGLAPASTDSAAFYSGGVRIAEDAHAAYAEAETRILRRIREVAGSGRDASLGSLVSGDPWERHVVDLASSGTIGGTPSEISVRDLASRSAEDDVVPESGVGALVASLSVGLPIRFSAPVDAIDISGRAVSISTNRGSVEARSCIVTAPVSVLASGRIRFSKEIDAKVRSSFGLIGMGTFEKIAFRLKRRPPVTEDFRVAYSELVAGRPHVVSFHPTLAVATVLYGADWARNIRVGGRAAQVAFGISVLKDALGTGIEAEIDGDPIVTDWAHDPWALGSYSYVRHTNSTAREIYQAELDERIAFAGEAAGTSAPSTVGGAWLSGTAAARRLLARL